MILLIDNYDSFTYNLVQFLGDLGARADVWRNDKLTVAEAMAKQPKAIVISPGPCDPDKAGICLDLIKAAAEAKVPLMGVCLGHQAIGQAFGGKIVRAQQLMHGKVDQMFHTGKGIFRNLQSPLNATRYHSLTIAPETFPDVLEITAKTADGTIMGLQHKSLPIHGVQFHPESIATEHGHDMLHNFLEITGVMAGV
ncbi:MAG: aminodeoxychorismate/anthranilate synthase component II [Pseudomonadota bacterium]